MGSQQPSSKSILSSLESARTDLIHGTHLGELLWLWLGVGSGHWGIPLRRERETVGFLGVCAREEAWFMRSVLVLQTGEGVNDVRKGACANHVSTMANFLKVGAELSPAGALQDSWSR